MAAKTQMRDLALALLALFVSSMPGFAAAEFAQVPAELAHPQREADARLRECLAIGGQDSRALVQAARRQRNIRGDDD